MAAVHSPGTSRGVLILVTAVCATLRISEGCHNLVLKLPQRANWTRTISVLRGSTVTVKATLDPLIAKSQISGITTNCRRTSGCASIRPIDR
jgi:hypothetical protein